MHLLLTCEHGGNRLPRKYVELFSSAQAALESHRGYDPGALELGKRLARRLHAPLIYSTTSRLLVELNRSTHHRALFSEFTRSLDRTSKSEILKRHYQPYRQRVEEWIERAAAQGGAVLHVSVHTFTPELNGETRNADIGLLYDPSRVTETRLGRAWQEALRTRRGELRVRRNYPYLGKADGFTAHLRRRFADESYAGIELEVNQLWPQKPQANWRRLQDDLGRSLEQLLASADSAA
jgi:predicted N-formylglutamate amidohydrolase